MKKYLIIVVIIVVFLFVTLGLALMSGKSNSAIIDDTLTSNNYVLSKDKSTYTKIVNGNNLNEFYNKSSMKVNTKYEEYTFNILSYDLVLFSINYYNSYYSTCSITGNLQTDITNYDCEFTYKNNSYIFNGNLENGSINCSNKKLNKKQVDTYCTYIGNRIDEFNIEKSKLVSNEEFRLVMKKKKQEIKVDE